MSKSRDAWDWLQLGSVLAICAAAAATPVVIWWFWL